MIDLGTSFHHTTVETFCPSCGTPESAGLGQHGLDCTIVFPDDPYHARQVPPQ